VQGKRENGGTSSRVRRPHWRHKLDECSSPGESGGVPPLLVGRTGTWDGGADAEHEGLYLGIVLR